MTLPDLPSHAVLLRAVGPARAVWRHAPTPMPDGATPGQESVWDYPRPPRLRQGSEQLVVAHNGTIIAATAAPLWLCETASAPVPYFAPAEIIADIAATLAPNGRVSICEWKGAAVSLDLTLPDGQTLTDIAWSYPDPLDDLGRNYAALAGRVAFYPARLTCSRDGERVTPQPGGFYGGWVTSHIAGPIKGAPGTGHW